jgi:hypothetical protein
MSAFFGIFLVNSIWEDGEQASLERERRMDRAYNSFPISMSIKGSFLMVKRMEQAFFDFLMGTFTMVNGLKV